MKTILKWTACALLLMLVITGLVACTTTGPNTDESTVAPDGSDVQETTVGDETTAEVQETSFKFYDGKDVLFKVVRPETAGNNSGAVEGAQLIAEALKTATGYSKSLLRTDFIKKGQEQDSTTYEILVGQVDYDQYREAMNDVSYGSSAVKVIGRKIVVCGWSDKNTVLAAQRLVEVLSSALVPANDYTIDVADLESSEIIDAELEDLPVLENGNLTGIYDCNDGVDQMIFEDATVEIYNAYLQKLEASGFTKYDAHSRGKVSFATYTNEKYTLNVIYQDHYKDIRLLVDEYDEKLLQPLTDEPYTKVCDTVIAQVGCEYDYSSGKPASDSQNGMLYVWRLEDGRFIILDAGFNYKLGADHIMKTLEKLAVDKNNIVIATWIFSHGHSDHTGAFIKFADYYASRVTVESFIYNRPTKEQSAEVGEASWNGTSNAVLKFPNATVYKALPGQFYQFANARIEIIYSLELYTPKLWDYFNTSTVVFDISFGDFNMMMLGDCSEPANEIIRNNYGDALESEVVQVAHHGYQGGSTALYRLINPVYVLWPAGSRQYSKCQSNATGSADRNYYFFASNTRIFQTAVAYDDVVVYTIEEDTGFTSYVRYDNVTDFVGDVKADSWPKQAA